MSTRKKFNKRRVILISLLVVGLAFLAIINIFDDTRERIAELRKQHSEEVKLKDFREELKNSKNPDVANFHKLNSGPEWSRHKIKNAVQQLCQQFDLSLRQIRFDEGKENAQEKGDYFTIHLNVGGVSEPSILAMVEHFKEHLAPWVRFKELTIQRSGSVDESMLKELKQGNKNDVIEARIVLDWLVLPPHSDHPTNSKS